MKKQLTLVIALTLLCQIIFSFYYNSEIIDQNNLLQSQTQTQNQLTLTHQKLEQQLSGLTSLQYLYPLIQSKKLKPIKQTFTVDYNHAL